MRYVTVFISLDRLTDLPSRIIWDTVSMRPLGVGRRIRMSTGTPVTKVRLRKRGSLK